MSHIVNRLKLQLVLFSHALSSSNTSVPIASLLISPRLTNYSWDHQIPRHHGSQESTAGSISFILQLEYFRMLSHLHKIFRNFRFKPVTDRQSVLTRLKRILISLLGDLLRLAANFAKICFLILRKSSQRKLSTMFVCVSRGTFHASLDWTFHALKKDSLYWVLYCHNMLPYALQQYNWIAFIFSSG